MKIRYVIIWIIFTVFNNTAFAQGQNLVGTVTNGDGEPLKGATITETSNGVKRVTETTADGTFKFTGISAGAVLLITHIGYETQQVKVQNRQELTIVLTQKTGELDEVIVRGYGTTTRRLGTGNITKVPAKEIETQPVSNPLAALEGRVPGVIISQTSGVPGSSFNVEIRGRTSLDQALSKNDPLFVIDGVFFEAGNQPANQLRSAANDNLGRGGLSPLNSINPGDIESIEILKDADATAIYGSRGANGVILITTKRGKAGATNITGNIYTAISNPGQSLKLLDTRQYVQMRKEGFKNDGVTPGTDPYDAGYAPDIMLWDTSRYTDFKKLLTGNTARTTDAQLSVSGGNRQTQFLLSGGFRRETNVFSASLADTRASMHIGINHISENRKLNMAFSGGYSRDRNRLLSTDLTQFIYLPPNLQLYDAAGGINWEEGGVNFATVNNISNPLSVLLKTNTSVIENGYGNLLAGYKILPSLTLKASLGYNTFKNDEVSVMPGTSVNPYFSAYVTPSASFANASVNNWTIEPQLNYVINTRKAKWDFLLGGTLQEKQSGATVIDASGYSNDLLLNNPAAAGRIVAGVNKARYRYEAVFGRIGFNSKDRYLLNGTFRRDGSSRFGPGRQFASFGAIGAGWIFSDERFAKQHLSFISFGKARMSYGITGNDQIGDYNFLNLWSAADVYQGLPTLLPAKLYNPDLQWETNKKLEVAIELGFLQNKLSASASYYRNRSGNQLVNDPLPTQAGSQNIVLNLPALVQNSGWELVVSSKNITSAKWKWTTSINITLPRNKLLSFPGLATSGYSGLYIVGKPLSVINRYKYLGVDPQTGVYTFADANKDSLLNRADYQVSGDLVPKCYGGLLNTISYQNVQLQFLVEFRKQTGKNYLSEFGYNPPGFASNQPAAVLNRWQKPGDRAGIQQFIATYSGSPAFIATFARLNQSDAIYGDASFIRLKNVSLSYNLPSNVVSKLKMSGIRAYINGQNLITISRYKGLDPETQNINVLPPLTTIAAGIQFTF